ncbi:UNVERIFIED_CONTAM: hypothetical protein Slati_3361000 [Sesamum latifolium]|uniref:Uncharacterized protein n=1 Tax=Sesamum latifolium TaxID=2727402 RepID=A0AAW2UH82_9LAMI
MMSEANDVALAPEYPGGLKTDLTLALPGGGGEAETPKPRRNAGSPTRRT